MKPTISFWASLLLGLLLPATAGATHYLDIRVVDQDYLMLHFRDGEVHYRDDGTGPSAFLGHSFAEGDDTFWTRRGPWRRTARASR